MDEDLAETLERAARRPDFSVFQSSLFPCQWQHLPFVLRNTNFLSWTFESYSYQGFFRLKLQVVFLDATTHLYKRSCPSVGPSVCPVLFSNDEKRPFRCSDDDEIWHAPRDSQGQFKNDIKMTVRRSVHPSKTKNKRKWTTSDDKVAASFEPRGSCFRKCRRFSCSFGVSRISNVASYAYWGSLCFPVLYRNESCSMTMIGVLFFNAYLSLHQVQLQVISSNIVISN